MSRAPSNASRRRFAIATALALATFRSAPLLPL